MTGSIAPNRPGHHGTVVARTVGTVAISCNGILKTGAPMRQFDTLTLFPFWLNLYFQGIHKMLGKLLSLNQIIYINGLTVIKINCNSIS